MIYIVIVRQETRKTRVNSERAALRQARRPPPSETSQGSSSRVCKLGEIAKFSSSVKKFQKKFPHSTLVIVTGLDAITISQTTFLVASYLLLERKSSVAEALSMLRSLAKPTDIIH